MFNYFSDLRNSFTYRFYRDNPSCIYHHNKGIFYLFGCIILIRFFLLTPMFVQGPSMQPSIFTHDLGYINRVAYDLKVPFVNVSLIEINTPMRGDVISVQGKEKVIVKRVVGLPGDHIKIINSVLYVNGKALKREPFKLTSKNKKSYGLNKAIAYDGFWETNGDSKYKVLYASKINSDLKDLLVNNFSNVSEMVVPDDHYYALGDNRVLSKDSRTIGFIDKDAILGKASFLFNYKNLMFLRDKSYPRSTL